MLNLRGSKKFSPLLLMLMLGACAAPAPSSDSQRPEAPQAPVADLQLTQAEKVELLAQNGRGQMEMLQAVFALVQKRSEAGQKISESVLKKALDEQFNLKCGAGAASTCEITERN